MADQVKTYAQWFPRCRHVPANTLDQANAKITAQQLAECVEDAGIIDVRRGQDRHKMGDQRAPDALVLGLLGEQVFASICRVPRTRARDSGLVDCRECNYRHGPVDFPSGLDVKAKWDDAPCMELTVNRRQTPCTRRFALVEVRRSRDEGCLWVVVPKWKMLEAPDVRRGRHLLNPRAVNWTWDSLVISRLCNEAIGDACMICGPPWPDDGRRGAGGAAVREMRRMLGNPEEEER